MKLHELNRVGESDLYKVVTVAEAAELVMRSPRTIRHHIIAGNFAARRAGRDYIISLESLFSYYERPRTA